MSSWVHKVRHIQDVAPWKRHVFWNGLKASDDVGRLWDDIEEREERFLKELPPFVERAHRPYFRSFLYDSYMLRVRRAGGKLTFTMNSLATEHFASNLDEMFGTSFYGAPWIVHLVAHDVAAFRMVQEDYYGRIRTMKIPPVLHRGNLTDYDPQTQPYYIRDFGRRLKGRIEWVVAMDRDTWFLVDCGRLTARDETRRAVTHRFGPTIRQIYDEVMGFRPSPLPVPNRSRGFYSDYIVDRVKSLGLTLDDVAEEIWQRKGVLSELGS